jgi:Flp pilus assembly protein TadB
MTSAIVTYLHRRKSRQAKAQAAASKATWRRLASSTWGTTAATDERKSDYREPNRDEADNLAPARGIAVSVLVGIAMWLAIVALVLLITWFFWVPT